MTRTCPNPSLIDTLAARPSPKRAAAALPVVAVYPITAASPLLPGRRCPSAKRVHRITVLITIIVCLSIADLLFTLIHLTGLGMIEANPLARALILTGDAQQLISFKLASIGIGCGCLFLGRRSARIELAAWICAVGLGALTVHWFNYNAEFKEIATDLAIAGEEAEPPGWLTLPN